MKKHIYQFTYVKGYDINALTTLILQFEKNPSK